MKRIVSSLILSVYVMGLNPVMIYGERKVERRIERVIEKESKLIEKEKGGVVVIGEVEIEIPAGALKKDTEISVSKLGITEKISEGLENVTEGARGYRFEPKGTKFKKDVIIQFSSFWRMLVILNISSLLDQG